MEATVVAKARNETPEVKTDPYGRELRFVPAQDIELRQTDDGETIGFVGHAAVFNRRANIMGLFTEEIAPGAFRKTVRDGDVRFLINHDPNYVLARNRAQTMTLQEDDVGLLVEADMAPTSYARDLEISLGRGDIDQMSFAFRTIRDSWEWPDEDLPHRRLEELQLFDVSVVTYPAYEDTDAGLRSRAFDQLRRAMDLDEETAARLLESLDNGEIDPELAPVLEAAGEALRALTRQPEPVGNHSVVPLDLYRRKHALKARQMEGVL